MIVNRREVSKVEVLKKRLISWFFINKRNILITSIIFLLLLFIYLLIIVFKIPQIQTTEIRYNNLVHEQKIDKVDIENYVNENIKSGYFMINILKMQEEIKNKSLLIESVIIRKEFPNKISIDINFYNIDVVLQNNENCILINDSSYVIDIWSMGEGSSCSDFIKENGTYLINNENTIEYKAKENTNFKFLKDIVDINNIFKEYKYVINRCEYLDSVLTCIDNIDRKYTFTSRDNIYEQEVRLVALLEQLQNINIKYKRLDLRFNRPVIEK